VEGAKLGVTGPSRMAADAVPRAREFRSGDFHEAPSTKLHFFLRNFTTRGHLTVFGFARFHLQEVRVAGAKLG
jgi:hypothetical protein